MKRQARLPRAALLTTLFTGVTTVFLLPVVAQKRAPEQAGHARDEKNRVYVTDSQSWESIGGWGLSGQRIADRSGSVGGGGYTAGGARPQTAEIIKSFNRRCPQVTITNNVQKADFAVLLDHEGGKDIYSIATKSLCLTAMVTPSSAIRPENLEILSKTPAKRFCLPLQSLGRQLR